MHEERLGFTTSGDARAQHVSDDDGDDGVVASTEGVTRQGGKTELLPVLVAVS